MCYRPMLLPAPGYPRAMRADRYTAQDCGRSIFYPEVRGQRLREPECWAQPLSPCETDLPMQVGESETPHFV